MMALVKETLIYSRTRLLCPEQISGSLICLGQPKGLFFRRTAPILAVGVFSALAYF